MEENGNKGKCSQDYIFLRKIDSIPEFVAKRMQRNLKECVICDGAGQERCKREPVYKGKYFKLL